MLLVRFAGIPIPCFARRDVKPQGDVVLETQNFVICLLFKGRQYFLVWRTGPGDEPENILISGEEKRLVITSTEEEIELIAEALGLPLELEDPYRYDVDGVFALLDKLTPDIYLQTENCKLLLDCWNIFEDMAKTLGISVNDMEEGNHGALSHAYEKLFYGNNLPSVTPDGKIFEPEFSPIEIGAMRAYFAAVWAELYAQCGIFWKA